MPLNAAAVVVTVRFVLFFFGPSKRASGLAAGLFRRRYDQPTGHPGAGVCKSAAHSDLLLPVKPGDHPSGPRPRPRLPPRAAQLLWCVLAEGLRVNTAPPDNLSLIIISALQPPPQQVRV